MSSKEEKELETLEKENLNTIEGVYSALIGDRQIQAYIEKIKAREWVKAVEGRENVQP